MNIEHKKTTLGDDSLLYQKRDDSLGKKDISNLSKLEKLGYFKDYYLKFVIVIIIIAACAIHLLYSTTIGRSVTLASVVCVDDAYLSESDSLSETLKDYLGSERKKDFVSVANYSIDDYQQNMAYVTQLTTGTVDLIICTKDYFEQGCNRGYFADLHEFLPEEMYAALEDQILEGSYAVTDDEGEVLSYDEPLPHGISLTGTTKYTEFGGMLESEDAVLCVTATSTNQENTLKVLSWFTDVPIPESYLETQESEPAE